MRDELKTRLNIKDSDLKTRKIELNISDNDLNTLAEICGRNGMTIQGLLETFIGDLTGGHYCSGSDESDLADQWLDRHGWSYGEENLLQWLMSAGGGLKNVEAIIEDWDEKKLYEADPEKYEADAREEGWKVHKWWNEDIQDITDGYKGAINDDEIDNLRDWLNSYQKITKE